MLLTNSLPLAHESRRGVLAFNGNLIQWCKSGLSHNVSCLGSLW